MFCLCILLVGGLWAASQVPALAEREFGPASPGLDFFERIFYSARLLAARDQLLLPAGPGGAPLDFEIAPGESANSVFYRLEQAGIVRSAEVLRNYIIYAGLDTGIQAGRYRLDPGMTPVEVARALQNAAPTEAVLVILPGWRAEEVAEALPTSGLSISPGEFMNAVRNPPAELVPPSLQPLTSLEGYFFPGEYRFPRKATLTDLITAVLSRFDSSVGADLREGFAANGLSLNEAVILASIVQREGVIDEEKPMIASVFYNRLAIGMKLDADPTAQYAYGYNEVQKTWWTNPLSGEQLNINSPYNTYFYAGLPPGPICNPGLSALQAVAYPAASPYYYFRASCDGSGRHEFAVTFEEHLQNACP
jgi:UPF0755 protein